MRIVTWENGDMKILLNRFISYGFIRLLFMPMTINFFFALPESDLDVLNEASLKII